MSINNTQIVPRVHPAFGLENMPNVPFFFLRIQSRGVFLHLHLRYMLLTTVPVLSQRETLERGIVSMAFTHLRAPMTLTTFGFLVKGFRRKGIKPSNNNGHKTKGKSKVLYSL